MDANVLGRHFARMGARLKLEFLPPTGLSGRWNVPSSSRPTISARLDVRRDRRGEYFVVSRDVASESEVEVVDVRPAERHLLLLVREEEAKHKFLCGHDERHWFVAAVPGKSVSNVPTAMEALKPAVVQDAEARVHVPTRDRKRRKNAAWIRQGEWFFVPEPDAIVNERAVLRDEPLVRSSRNKPHMAEFCFRYGGQTVYVCPQRPAGVSEFEYKQIIDTQPGAKYWPWRSWVRDMTVLVRGRIRHPDHATLVLNGWHRVLMNTENETVAMEHVAFLD